MLAARAARDFEGLVAVLDPEVVVRIDEAAARPGAPREIGGARNWAKGAMAFARFGKEIEPMLVNGVVGLVWAPLGTTVTGAAVHDQRRKNYRGRDYWGSSTAGKTQPGGSSGMIMRFFRSNNN